MLPARPAQTGGPGSSSSSHQFPFPFVLNGDGRIGIPCRHGQTLLAQGLDVVFHAPAGLGEAILHGMSHARETFQVGREKSEEVRGFCRFDDQRIGQINHRFIMCRVVFKSEQIEGLELAKADAVTWGASTILESRIGAMNREVGRAYPRAGSEAWPRLAGTLAPPNGSWRASFSILTCLAPMNRKCINGWKSSSAFGGSWGDGRRGLRV